MAKIAPKTSPKSPWGVPLVLPHVLLSVGLLLFATMSERAAQPPSTSSATAILDAGTVADADPRDAGAVRVRRS